MTPIAKRGLLAAGGFVVLVAALLAVFVTFNDAAARGIAIGVALGLANLAVSLFFTKRALHKGVQGAMATIVAGFSARLVVLVALFLVFKQTSTIDAAAFALTFVAFFFVYLAVEIVQVEQLRAPRTA